jgi:hypothetical protein
VGLVAPSGNGADSVDQIRGIAERAAQTPMADTMLRQALETPTEENREQRVYITRDRDGR